MSKLDELKKHLKRGYVYRRRSSPTGQNLLTGI